ncbi:MAG: hypothetical protein ACRDK4_09295 [Solirubrobacteraceae bacterium]
MRTAPPAPEWPEPLDPLDPLVWVRTGAPAAPSEWLCDGVCAAAVWLVRVRTGPEPPDPLEPREGGTPTLL